ncbi:MAG TPA: YceI family protein [Roseiflexaceae bacterium]|nr:YceI family protein [Roseiflexaceae bacterium]
MSSMSRIAIVAGVVVVIVLGVVGYTVLRPPESASQPLEAVPLATATAAATEAASAPTALPEPTAAPATMAPEPTVAEPTTAPAAPATPAASTASGEIVAQILPGESQARFVIDEVLNNSPKTVVGTTDQVAGELAVNLADPSQTRVGTITINARTLTTDSEFRNRAIKNQILATDSYEFITFTPSQIVGLPANAQAGQSYTFQIAGDLTIKGVTRPITFDVSVNPVSNERLEGKASSTVTYADFGISIPRVPNVASVADQVRLELDFVAVPKA